MIFLKFLFTVVAITGVMASCSDKGNDPEPGGKGELILTASTDEITADGIDAVTFTVTYDGDDVTSSAVIKQSNGAVVEGAEFVATAAGTYKFTAEYDEVTSNEVSVKADISLTAIVLSVDKNEIVNDGIDAATFTVTLGGEDITSSSELRVNNTPMDGVEFTNRTKGRYTFMAVYEGRVSNQIAIQVVDAELVLSIDKSLIIADGEDAAVLTAMYGGLDVTDEVEVRNNQNKVVPTTLVFDIWSNPNSYLMQYLQVIKSASFSGYCSKEGITLFAPRFR